MTVVVDTSAVVALLYEETSEVDLRALVPGATMCNVNYSEVVDRLARDDNPADAIAATLNDLRLHLVSLSDTAAFEAGVMRPVTDRLGLSLGDRICLAVAKELTATLLTADHDQAEAASNAGVEVQLVRQRRNPALEPMLNRIADFEAMRKSGKNL